MRPHLQLSLALLAATAASAFALSQETTNQELETAAGGRLVVDVDFGSVDVSAGPAGKFSLEAQRKIDSGDDARDKAYLAAAPLIVAQEGGVITVRARNENGRRDWNWDGNVNMDAHYTIRLPKAFNVELHTGGGSVAVNGLKGEIRSKTNGGSLEFVQVEGPIDGRTNGGRIRMDGCVGETNVTTNGGSIMIGNGKGRLSARTAGGSITIRRFVGDTDVKTNGGSLTLENISGRINGRTSAGSINVSLVDPVTAEVNLDSSAGSIELSVPPKAGLDVDAKTSMGKIRTEIPMLALKSDDDRLQGTLNGGGKSVVLRASVGSITIRPNDSSAVAHQISDSDHDD